MSPLSSRARVAFLLILLLGAALRFLGAGRELWTDEINQLRSHIRQPTSEILLHYKHGNHQVAIGLLAKGSAALFGETPLALRLPAILLGIATIAVFFSLARLFFAEELALAAALMFAVDGFAIFYSQQLRGYSGHLFCALLSTRALIGLRRGAGRSAEAVLAGATAFDPYFHLTAVPVTAGQLLSLAVPGPARLRALRGLALGSLGAFLLYWPMLGDLIAYYGVENHGFGFGLLSSGFATMLRPHLPVLVVIAAAGAVGAISLLRREPVGAATLFAPATVVLVGPLLSGALVYPRFLLFLFPVALLVGVEGARLLARSGTRRVAVAVAALSIAGAALRLPRFYTVPFQPFRQALEAVRGEHRPIIGLSLGGDGLSFYDPSVVTVRTVEAADEALARTNGRALVAATFLSQLRSALPELYDWMEKKTVPYRRFPGWITDADVVIRHAKTEGPAPP